MISEVLSKYLHTWDFGAPTWDELGLLFETLGFVVWHVDGFSFSTAHSPIHYIRFYDRNHAWLCYLVETRLLQLSPESRRFTQVAEQREIALQQEMEESRYDRVA